jgi:putative membrane protein
VKLLLKILKWLVLNGIAFFVAAKYVDGMHLGIGNAAIQNLHLNETGNQIVAAVVVGTIFSIVNFWVRPIIKLISLPVTIVTLGLFSIVINILMLIVTEHILGNNWLHFDNLSSTVVAFVIIAVVNTVVGFFE